MAMLQQLSRVSSLNTRTCSPWEHGQMGGPQQLEG